MIVLPVLSLATVGPARGGGDDRGGATGPTILVVEDDANTRQVLALLLELRGFQVLQSGDGEAGLQVVVQVGVDLVVSDLQLPGMSGLELARAIARRDGHPPMIAITADDDRLRAQAEDSDHFADVLRKPIDVNRLLDLVDSLTN